MMLNQRKNSAVIEERQRIIIGIAGGSAAGKTTLCENINRQMAFDSNFKVQILSLDCFYKNIDKRIVTDVSEYNFDHPNALDFDLAYQTLLAMKQGSENVTIPQYSFTEHRRLETVTKVSTANVIFFEGLMAFYDKRIRDLMTYKIFIHCDDDIRLCRRLQRDTTERGRSVISVLKQYNKFVRDAFRNFIQPTIIYADLIIPGFRNNRVSVDFIVQHIRNISNHITFKETLRKNKTYFFGENQFYDLDYMMKNSEDKMGYEHQSFLVFPTADFHKQELKFFLGLLISELFQYAYFKEVYLSQFLKVLKALFRQLIELKRISLSQIQLIPFHRYLDSFRIPSPKPYKILLWPVASTHQTSILKSIKTFIEQNGRRFTFIILNFFADYNFPSLIYQLELKNTIFVNLYIIANEKNFRDTLTNNIREVPDHLFENFKWFTNNSELMLSALKSFQAEFAIQQSWDENRSLLLYQSMLKVWRSESNHTPIKTLQMLPNSNPVPLGITQILTMQQEHSELCGYHTLINIILGGSQGKNLKSREKFAQHYFQLQELLQWKKSGKEVQEQRKFKCMEQFEMDFLIKQGVAGEKIVKSVYLSRSYITNSWQEIEDIDNLLAQVRSGQLPRLFLVMGVFEHYFLLEVESPGTIYYIDSMNYPLAAFTSPSLKLVFDNKKLGEEIAMGLQIIRECVQEGRKLTTIFVELRIQQMIGNFNSFVRLDDPSTIDKWVHDEYRLPVITSQLLDYLQKIKIQDLTVDSRLLLENWLKTDFILHNFPSYALKKTPQGQA